MKEERKPVEGHRNQRRGTATPLRADIDRGWTEGDSQAFEAGGPPRRKEIDLARGPVWRNLSAGEKATSRERAPDGTRGRSWRPGMNTLIFSAAMLMLAVAGVVLSL